jgi:hypothetical protein
MREMMVRLCRAHGIPEGEPRLGGRKSRPAASNVMPFVSLSCTHDELMKTLSLLSGPQAGQFRGSGVADQMWAAASVYSRKARGERRNHQLTADRDRPGSQLGGGP